MDWSIEHMDAYAGVGAAVVFVGGVVCRLHVRRRDRRKILNLLLTSKLQFRSTTAIAGELGMPTQHVADVCGGYDVQIRRNVKELESWTARRWQPHV